MRAWGDMRPAAKVHVAIEGLIVACQYHTDAEIPYGVACGKLYRTDKSRWGAPSSTGCRGASGRITVCTFAAISGRTLMSVRYSVPLYETSKNPIDGRARSMADTLPTPINQRLSA